MEGKERTNQIGSTVDKRIRGVRQDPNCYVTPQCPSFYSTLCLDFKKEVDFTQVKGHKTINVGQTYICECLKENE